MSETAYDVTAQMISKLRSLWRAQYTNLILEHQSVFSGFKQISTLANDVNSGRPSNECGTSLVCQNCSLLVRVLLGIPKSYKKTLDLLIDSYGLEATVETLQRVKALLDPEGLSLVLLFKPKRLRDRDAFLLSRDFIRVSQFHGVQKSLVILKQNPYKITFMSKWIKTKNHLERNFGLKGINPGLSTVRKMSKTSWTLSRKIIGFKQVLPMWCLRRLIEDNRSLWFNHNVYRLRQSLSILQTTFQSIMSPKSAKEGSLLCIARCSRILDNTPKELKNKIDVFRGSILGEGFADFILRYPNILSPTYNKDVDAQYQQFTAWTSAVLFERNVTVIASLGGIYSLYSSKHTRTIERLQFIATIGSINNDLPLTYYIRQTKDAFNESYPRFQTWKEIFKGNKYNEVFVKEIQNHLLTMFNEIDVNRFQQRYPVFKTSINKMDSEHAGTRVRNLVRFFGYRKLHEVTSASTANRLMLIPTLKIRTAFSELRSEFKLTLGGVRRLLLRYPSIMSSKKARIWYTKKLRLYLESRDDLNKVLNGDLHTTMTSLETMLPRYEVHKKGKKQMIRSN
eukprot:g4132.t1